MTIADENRQGGSSTPDLTGGTSVTGSEPATPALGASTSTSSAGASGISVNDGMTAGSGPDVSRAAPGIGGMAASSGGTGTASTGSTGALGLGTTTSTSGSAMGGDQSGKLSQVKQQASEQASKLKDQATDKLRSAAVDGKSRAAESIDGFAQTVHETAQKLEQQAGPQVGRYAHQAADALDQLASTLRNKDVDELWSDAQQLMRRSPALAIGAAAAVGFALSRFLKASSDRLEPNYGSSYGGRSSLSEPTAAGIDTGYPASTTRTNGNGSSTGAYNA